MAKKTTQLRNIRALELDKILSDYVEILSTAGPESSRELAYLKKYSEDTEAMKLLRGARAVKALFESFDQFPEDFERPSTKKTRQVSKSR